MPDKTPTTEDAPLGVRYVPADLYRRLKIAAATRGVTLRAALIASIDAWITHGGPPKQMDGCPWCDIEEVARCASCDRAACDAHMSHGLCAACRR